MGKLRKGCDVMGSLAANRCAHRAGSQYPEAYISLEAGVPVSLKYIDAVSLAGQSLLEGRTFWQEY